MQYEIALSYWSPNVSILFPVALDMNTNDRNGRMVHIQSQEVDDSKTADFCMNTITFSFCSNSMRTWNWECRFHTVAEKVVYFTSPAPFGSQAELLHQINHNFVFTLR